MPRPAPKKSGKRLVREEGDPGQMPAWGLDMLRAQGPSFHAIFVAHEGRGGVPWFRLRVRWSYLGVVPIWEEPSSP